MSNPALEWPTEQIETLRTMAERRLSASEIARALAAQLGIARSRCAVIGKLFRLREEGTPPPGRLPRLKVEAGARYGKYVNAGAKMHRFAGAKMHQEC